MDELKSIGSVIIVISRKETVFSPESVDIRLELDTVLEDMLIPLPTAAALQLIAYYTSVLRGIDPDKPRNVAKSLRTE